MNTKKTKIELGSTETDKKITKRKKAIKALKVSMKFESFYTGGKLTTTNNQIFMGIYQDKIRVFKLETFDLIGEIAHESEDICDFEFITDNVNSFIYTFTKNGMLRFFKIIFTENNTSFELVELNRRKIMNFYSIEMKIDRSRKYLVLCDPSGSFKIVQTQTLKMVREFVLGMGLVKMRLINTYILFLSRERELIFYNISTNQRNRIIKSKQDVSFSDFVILESKNKDLLLSGFDQNLYISKGQTLIKTDYKIQDTIQIMESLKINNQILILIGYESGTLELAQYIPEQNKVQLLGQFLIENSHPISKILFDYTSQKLFVVTEESEFFELKIIKQQDKLSLKKLKEIQGLNDETLDLKFLDQNNFVLCTNSEVMTCKNIITKQSLFIQGHQSIVTTLEIGDKEMFSGDYEGKIIHWKISQTDNDLYEFSILKKYKAHQSSIVQLIRSKKNNFLISCDVQGFLKYWDLENQNCQNLKIDSKDINFVKLSPNEKYFITGSRQKTLNIYSTKELKLLQSIKAHNRGIWDGDFEQTSPQFVTGSSDMTIKIWSVQNPSQIFLSQTLEGSSAAIVKVKWLLFGLQIISGQVNGVIQIWNVKKGTVLSTYENHQGKIWALEIFETENQYNILIGDNNNGLMLWQDDTINIDSDDKLQRQEKIALIDNLNIELKQQKFREALLIAFEKNMNKSFFMVIQKWLAYFQSKTDIIYNVDLDSEDKYQFNIPQEFEQAILEIWNQNKERVLFLIKSFITIKQMNFVVLLVLRVILKNNIVYKIESLNDELKVKDCDLQQLLNIFQIFNQRNKMRIQKSLKLSRYINYQINLNKI